MSPRPIDRLLVPKSIALVGGTWTDAVAKSCQTIGFDGPVWRIHPTRQSTPDTHYYRSIDELPEAPDATFLAAPNRDVPDVAAALNRRGAGGFVCFAAGFSETATSEGQRLTQALSEAAGDLPFFGPNCYGFINFFDRVALWPDQVVGNPVKRGVALICQSGTLALNLMFSQRSLPIGYLITVRGRPRYRIWPLRRGHQGHAPVRPGRRQGTPGRQGDRVGKDRAHGGGCTHHPEPYGGTGRRRCSV